MRPRPMSMAAAGASLLVLAGWGLWRDVGWIAQPFYAWAWWGYILLLDGLVALRRGRSLLASRPRLAAAMGLWSVSFWFFFELLNTRFQNWYYVGVQSVSTWVEALGAGAFVFLAFSTVFIGIFETYAALTALGLFRGCRGAAFAPGRPSPPWASYAVQGLGLAMAALAVGFPRYLAPLVWGSFTLLVDPWNYRHGGRSILQDFERRDWGFVARVFLAGLVCGLVWESLNFFAPQKWIYTVRGLEGLKLFEMPLLGFLGFPALAFDAFAAFALVSRLSLGNAVWEEPEDLDDPPVAGRPWPRVLTLATLPLHCVFWLWVTWLSNAVNVASLELTLGELPALPVRAAATLEAEGLRRPGQLLSALRDPARRASLAGRLAMDAVQVARLEEEADLYTFKGIGAGHGAWLEAAGVRGVGDLALRSPEDLHAEMVTHSGGADFPPLRLDMVRVWVLAARDRGIVLRAAAGPSPR
ncbi:MAG: DUF4332 domain-containing protein [Planctomycetes bacterium]|nr:DUF4332 domain-containing protein [Planctomycetota bacterium]